ncbi:site-specific integrase [Moorella sp. E308F]|uniref:tyrosine-type recombinase/integrase n=1 Tax=unclassified Neomoorella TaxID=2676739 RepID=UPI0010FFC323|nr:MULTISPECIES: site-specific integrase [unclassified Moorella (in: firmicutes)]GEA15567.1 site-specific integrase [Moorella sp. E308F]GEA19575.1 site-specific integrase [Moorella sp. E306M]
MARKRGNNEGTISKRKDGRWCAAITVGRTEEGKQKRIFFYGKTRQEVADKLAKALNDIKQGTFVEPDKLTVGEWLDTWLNEYVKPHVRPTTWGGYEYIVRQHLKPALGKIRLKDLRPDHLQKLYNEKLAGGRVDGQGQLSNRTVRLMHVVIHAALKQAMKNQLVIRNVADATKPPSLKKKEIRVLSPEEQARFISILKDDRLGAAFLLDLATGLRRGELLGLRWRDVNLEEGTITINQSLVEVRTGNAEGKKTMLMFQEPKTKQSKRTIPIPKSILTELKAHKIRQDHEKSQAGPKYQDNDLVFATAEGKPINPRNFNRSFYRLVKKAGLPPINPHALRHTFATRLLEADEHPKVVQDLLGHSQISLTLDTYSHASMDLKRRAAEKLDKILEVKKNSSDETEE